MARVKTSTAKIKAELNQQEKLEARDEFGKPLFIQCKSCNRIKAVKDYLTCQSTNNTTGYTYICKNCCSMLSLDNEGYFNKEKVYALCEIIDKPFINKIFETVDTMMNSAKTKPVEERKKISVYINILNGTKSGFRTAGFDRSEEIESNAEKDLCPTEKDIQEANLELWGQGWTDNEYIQLNKKYNMLLNNYPLRTEMHKEMLVKYCKYALREDIAVAEANTIDAKEWGKLAKDTAAAAKINPNQLSAADISDGMTCFAQLSAVVEKAQDIIPLLPTFIEKPKDRVDYTLWEYVNYARHLLGKPLCEYKDIYKFLNARYESLKNRYAFLKEENDGKFDSNDIDS